MQDTGCADRGHSSDSGGVWAVGRRDAGRGSHSKLLGRKNQCQVRGQHVGKGQGGQPCQELPLTLLDVASLAGAHVHREELVGVLTLATHLVDAHLACTWPVTWQGISSGWRTPMVW